ncbi:DnaB-like helicase C-terminal domain-containing protein [Mycoplasma buteonis]|uniref:DnaB-like helicase C-terminal domain-containing protein n=1 Tax=Mycoplasma buteonis TaxID=171280 RepID=UPI000564C2B1|nr:DnaB-like helicase C-terminal domain-containing protein [Mycoplasma buteonis]
MSKNNLLKKNTDNFKNVKINPDTAFFDLNLEKRILSTMLAFADKQAMGISYLKPELFFDQKCREMFNLFVEWKSNKSSEITWFDYNNIFQVINEDLESPERKYKKIDIAFLNEIAVILFNEENFVEDLETLKEKANLRNLEAIFNYYSSEMQKIKFDKKFKEILGDFEEYIVINNNNTIEGGQFKTINDVSQELQQTINNILANKHDLDELKTDFEAIDRYVQGFKPGQFIILAARPGVGKTALALNIANNVALQHTKIKVDQLSEAEKSKHRAKNVAFISLEMPVKELISRVISSTVQLPLNYIQNPKRLVENQININKFQYFFESKLEEMNIYFDDTATSKISDMIWKIKNLHKQLNGNLDLIVIDYLQLISASDVNGNRQNEVSVISRSLKTLALELKVPILALSQLSRSVENREDKRPQIHDLRESGAIEQDADIVILLHRDMTTNLKNDEETNSKNHFNEQMSGSKTIVSVAKNRNGQIGSGEFIYLGSTVTFFDRNKNKGAF